MINFTTTLSKQFWEKNIPELSIFFENMEKLEYWTLEEDDIFPYLVFFEIQLNSFKKLSIVFNDESYFNNIIEIFSYFKLGTFIYVLFQINKENSAFLISSLLNCKQEHTIHDKLFIERFKLLEKNNLLSKLFNAKKTTLIKTIIDN